MSIGSIGGSSALSQAYLSQQAQAVLAQSFDPQTAASSSAAASGGTDASANALTGIGTSALDSQTLQALMQEVRKQHEGLRALPLMRLRFGQPLLLPTPEDTLLPGDLLLFAGCHRSRRLLRAAASR